MVHFVFRGVIWIFIFFWCTPIFFKKQCESRIILSLRRSRAWDTKATRRITHSRWEHLALIFSNEQIWTPFYRTGSTHCIRKCLALISSRFSCEDVEVFTSFWTGVRVSAKREIDLGCLFLPTPSFSLPRPYVPNRHSRKANSSLKISRAEKY